MPQLTDAQTQTLLTIIRHHREQPMRPGFDEDGREVWTMILAKLDALVAPVVVEIEAVMNSRTLNAQGQQEALSKIGPRVVGNFQNLGVVLREADAAKARLETLLFSPITKAPAGNEVVQELRQAELRRTIGKGRADAAFVQALEADDLDTARALLTAPGARWVSEEMRIRGQNAYGQRTRPKAWDKLQYVNYLREHLSALADPVAQWLRHLGASAESIQQATSATD